MYKIPDVPTCKRGTDLIAFLYGETDELAAQDFERHLLNCAECESELGAFKQIRSSAVAWRQESLGAATASWVAAPRAADRASDPGKPSAIAAVRKFFELSPLWMKGSVAFASVLFCALFVLALAHLFQSPPLVVAGDEKRYTEKELQAKIEDVLKSGLPDREAQNREAQKLPVLPSVAADSDQQVKSRRRGTNPSSARVPTHPQVKRGPLTKSEREQLAADLRLIFPHDDTDLDLLWDGINH